MARLLSVTTTTSKKQTRLCCGRRETGPEDWKDGLKASMRFCFCFSNRPHASRCGRDSVLESFIFFYLYLYSGLAFWLSYIFSSFSLCQYICSHSSSTILINSFDIYLGLKFPILFLLLFSPRVFTAFGTEHWTSWEFTGDAMW